MTALAINLDSQTPINDQIVFGLRRAIATGELTPDTKLPSVRQLAADLGVNLNTVARAYRALEASGLVTTVRGRGTRVVSSIEHENARATANVSERLKDAVTDAKLAGMTQATLRQAFSDVLEMFFIDLDNRSGDTNDC
jgi:GntR family transcriptional regulator